MRERTHPADLDKELTESQLGSEPAYPVGDPDREDYAEYARKLWDEQDEELEALHNTWVQNLLFLSGRQWWRPNASGVWAPEPAPSWRERPVSNLTLAYFRTAVAKVTKNRPAWQVKPASGDPEDVKAAELAENVLEAKWHELKLGRMMRRAAAWALTTGNAFIYPYWNTQTGKVRPLEIPVEVPKNDEMGSQIGTELAYAPADEDGEPFRDQLGEIDFDAEATLVDEGDVGFRMYSPFQVRVNPEAESDEDVVWFIIAEVKSLQAIREFWPETGEDAKAEDPGVLGDYDKLVGSLMGGADTHVTSPAMDRRNEERSQALVLYYHEKPSTAFPNGRYWVSVNDDILLEEPGDLPDGIWPALIHLKDVDVPGLYYGKATMEEVTGINREYNEMNAQIKEHHKLMARGKWVVDRGTGIKKGMITSQPGEVLQVNTGFRDGVKQIEVRPLPAAVYDERERILKDFEMVGGIHKISLGTPPPGVTAGVAMMQLQEADDTDFGPILAAVEETVEAMGTSMLQIIRERYTDDRLIHIVGPNNKYMVRSFSGADLEGALDVVVQSGSSAPWNKTAMQSMYIQLAAQLPQLFSDPMSGQFDSGKFARLLPIGGLSSITEHEDMDIAEALRENDLFSVYGIESQEIPQVMWWNNHDIHYNQHVQVLKSERFKEWDEESQKQFMAHVQAHDVQRKAAMMQAMGMAQPGGGPMEEEAPPDPGNAPGDTLMAPPEEQPGRPVDPLSDNNDFGMGF